MKTVLHLGAHRTATTSFQFYLRDQRAALTAGGIGFWGPWRTRKGLFAGIFPLPEFGAAAPQFKRASGRIELNRLQAQRRGVHTLVVSDENMLGSMSQNLKTGLLYPSAGERMARYFAAFRHQIDQIVLVTRALDQYWASAAAYCTARGHVLPPDTLWAQIASSARTWRDVITDISCAMPDAPLRVLPFERFAGQPAAMLSRAADCAAPRASVDRWMNKGPGAMALREVLQQRGDPSAAHVPETRGRWTPFDLGQRVRLQARYSDDMMWLRAGADGLAQIVETADQAQAGGYQWPGRMGFEDRGRPTDGIEKRHMARPG